MTNFVIWLNNLALVRYLTSWCVAFHASPALWGVKLESNDHQLVICLGPLDFEYQKWKLRGRYFVDDYLGGVEWVSPDWEEEDDDVTASETEII